MVAPRNCAETARLQRNLVCRNVNISLERRYPWDAATAESGDPCRSGGKLLCLPFAFPEKKKKNAPEDEDNEHWIRNKVLVKPC